MAKRTWYPALAPLLASAVSGTRAQQRPLPLHNATLIDGTGAAERPHSPTRRIAAVYHRGRLVPNPAPTDVR